MNSVSYIPLTSTIESFPKGALSVSPLDESSIITANIMVRRPIYNGMSMQTYANLLASGQIREHLSYAEFEENYNATSSDINLVTEFVSQSGFSIVDIAPAAATVKISGTVEIFKNTFKIDLQTIQTPNHSFIGYNGVMLIPAELEGVIEYIRGLHNSAKISHHAIPANLSANIQTALTPAQVATAYNFPLSNGYGVCVGIIEYGGGYTTQNLTSSFGRIGLSNPQTVDVLVSGAINDPTDTNASPEVMLDIYVCGGVVPNAKLAIYFAPNTIFEDPINTAIHDKVNSPSVLSISWAGGETDWSSSAIAAVEAVFAQAVILGISICVSSGDQGSSYANSGTKQVLYPASSRYVVGVGGTTLTLSGSTRSSEIAWAGSGGGVSTVFSLPSYQAGLSIETYPSLVTSSLTVRGVPDVSANANPNTGYQFYCGSQNTFSQYGGTSAAAPLIAGLIAQLIQLTGRRVGLANTLFYSNTGAFYDVTTGNNAYGSVSGYTATNGWDAVTGLGVPIGSNIFRLFNIGAVYPVNNFGFRPASGAVWPRVASGARSN